MKQRNDTQLKRKQTLAQIPGSSARQERQASKSSLSKEDFWIGLSLDSEDPDWAESVFLGGESENSEKQVWTYKT